MSKRLKDVMTDRSNNVIIPPNRQLIIDVHGKQSSGKMDFTTRAVARANALIERAHTLQ